EIDGAYDFLGQRKSWTRVDPTVIERMRCEWLPNCKYIKDIPSKNETRKIMRDEQNEPIVVQTAVCRHRPREVHNFMILPEEQGGFDGATDTEGHVLISETKLRWCWPNWIRPMTQRLKEMCACDKCGVMYELQVSYNRRRQKIIDGLCNDIE
ncbi:hypothetical protein ACHAWF_018121, partial [Thalassiosira exigua]